MNFERERKAINSVLNRMEGLMESLKSEKLQLAKETTQLEHSHRAQELLQLISQAIQQKAHERISRVVSSCLSAVFDSPYSFKIEFERKRGRTEARLLFIRDGLEVDPMTASGGGMIDVAAFALRAACLVLHRPRLRRVLILDEPFKFVSSQYRENVRAMLEGLAKDLKIQIIQVTHDSAYETGKVIEL